MSDRDRSAHDRQERAAHLVGKFIIYALHHDDSKRVYVGKSTSGMTRPKAHAKPANLKRLKHLPVSAWIKKYQDFKIAVLEELDSGEALFEAERFHIAYLRSLGILLLNCTDGGEGMLNPSPETRAKMSAAQKILRNTPEARRAMSGRVASKETREKLAEAARARYPQVQQRMLEGLRSPQAREKISARTGGRKLSEVTKEKLRQIARSRSPRSEEANRKAGESLRGRKRTEEICEKLSKAWYDRSPEQRAAQAAQMIEMNKTRVQTAEQRAKVSAAVVASNKRRVKSSP